MRTLPSALEALPQASITKASLTDTQAMVYDGRGEGSAAAGGRLCIEAGPSGPCARHAHLVALGLDLVKVGNVAGQVRLVAGGRKGAGHANEDALALAKDVGGLVTRAGGGG